MSYFIERYFIKTQKGHYSLMHFEKEDAKRIIKNLKINATILLASPNALIDPYRWSENADSEKVSFNELKALTKYLCDCRHPMMTEAT